MAEEYQPKPIDCPECVNLRSRLAVESLESTYTNRISELVRTNRSQIGAVEDMAMTIGKLSSDLRESQLLVSRLISEVNKLHSEVDRLNSELEGIIGG